MSDNPDELFDVVDAEDKVVGIARRADVHANGWLHRAVHILVHRENGDVFLQKRSMYKDCHPGVWDSSASGHLDSGEAYAPAAIRELEEELGIISDMEKLHEIAVLDASEQTGQEFVRIYAVRHDGSIHLHPTEIAEGKWLPPDALESWLLERPDDFAPCFRVVWEIARGYVSSFK